MKSKFKILSLAMILLFSLYGVLGCAKKEPTGNLAYDAYVQYNRRYNKSVSEWEEELRQGRLPESKLLQNTQNSAVRAVAHRGNSFDAPENTLIAFVLAKIKGFTFAECDVRWTKDGVAVLLHDSSISRTSNGKGEISSIDYSSLAKNDFGSWKANRFKNTKIPTFEEFILTCSYLGIHPYIEIKENPNIDKLEALLELINKYNMQNKSTIISFNFSVLENIKNLNPATRLGYLTHSATNEEKAALISLKTEENQVFLSLNYNAVNAQVVQNFSNANIGVEVWTVNNLSLIPTLKGYNVSGITSDNPKIAQLLA